MTPSAFSGRWVLAGTLALLAGTLATQFRTQAQTPDNLTPGMLFGPVWLGPGQHIELCASNLGEGDITAAVHFRNLSTGDVSPIEQLTLTTGGGECAYYVGSGRIVGMARGDGRASDWVSPSNALISTMSVVDDGGSTRVSVLGVAKVWLRGL